MNNTCLVSPFYNRYGTRQGYNCYAVGKPTFWAKSIKIAKEWAKSLGLEIVHT